MLSSFSVLRITALRRSMLSASPETHIRKPQTLDSGSN